jgi:hypothetical protein
MWFIISRPTGMGNPWTVDIKKHTRREAVRRLHYYNNRVDGREAVMVEGLPNEPFKAMIARLTKSGQLPH